MTSHSAKFSVGQIVGHRLFAYRGVVADVDATFQLSDDWYEQVALTRPSKDQPWYHVLVDDSDHVTYVAERNLTLDESSEPIRHPLVEQFFDDFSDGHYTSARHMN